MGDEIDTLIGVSNLLTMFPQEPLVTELERFRRYGTHGVVNIKHPLVYSIFHTDVMDGWANKQLREKRKLIKAAIEAQDWETYVWLHERPWRIEAFWKIRKHLTDAEYWELLGNFWIDSENIQEKPHQWEKLMLSDRPKRPAIMTVDEQRMLSELPDEMEVWQGRTVRRSDGMSWTLKRSTAAWFANRFASMEEADPALSVGMVHKSDIIAYFHRRNEAEVIVPEHLVRDVTTGWPHPHLMLRMETTT